MTPTELKQIFDNNFDCYADSNEVIPAMTRERFVEVVSKLMGLPHILTEPEATDKPTPKPEVVPPDDHRDVLVKLEDGREFKGWYCSSEWRIIYPDSKDQDVGENTRPGDTVVSWKEIPPAPEGERGEK